MTNPNPRLDRNNNTVISEMLALRTHITNEINKVIAGQNGAWTEARVLDALSELQTIRTNIVQMNMAMGLIGSPTTGSVLGRLDRLQVALGALSSTAGTDGLQTTSVRGLLNSIAALLDELDDDIGEATGDATTTLLGRLAAIERLTATGLGLNPPTGTACSAPALSTGQLLAPFAIAGGTNVIYAQWPEALPGGVVFGSIFGVNGPRVELNLAPGFASWDGWRIAAMSRAQQFAYDMSINRYPTNQWVPLSGNGPIAVSVEAIYGVTAWICPPTVAGGQTINSYAIGTAQGPGQNIFSPNLNPPFGGINSDHTVNGNIANYSFRVVSNIGNVRFRRQFSPTQIVDTVLTDGRWYHTRSATTRFQIYNIGLGPFSIQWGNGIVAGSIPMD